MPYTFDYHFLRKTAKAFEILNMSNVDVTLRIASLGVECELRKASRTVVCRCNYSTMQRNFIVELGQTDALTHTFTRLDSPFHEIDYLLIEPAADLHLRSCMRRFACLNDVLVDLSAVVFQNIFENKTDRSTISSCSGECAISAHFS